MLTFISNQRDRCLAATSFLMITVLGANANALGNIGHVDEATTLELGLAATLARHPLACRGPVIHG
jgi:hypothetical protein